MILASKEKGCRPKATTRPNSSSQSGLAETENQHYIIKN